MLPASRDPERGQAARAAIMGELPAASVELVELDLADLVSVQHLADRLLGRAAGLDLLIVGSRGHGGFASALLGSVSLYCVLHAHCPVLVLRDGREGTGGHQQRDEREPW